MIAFQMFSITQSESNKYLHNSSCVATFLMKRQPGLFYSVINA